MGLVSGLSLANHSDSIPGGTCIAQLRWITVRRILRRWVGHMDWCLLSPFDFSQILPGGGDLLVPLSLPRPPLTRQPMQMVTIGSGHGGQFWSMVPLTD